MSVEPRDLAQRLAEAEATIAALLSGQIDAVLDPETKTPLLLSAAQAALRESEARYRRILETANEGILTIDALSRISFVNQRVTEILGYSSEDMIGKSFLRFVSESAGILAALRAERSEQGLSSEYEVSFLCRDGSELWALLKTSPIRDADKHAGTLLMMTDRTRDRQDEAELRTREAHYRQIVELAPEGILKIDDAGSIVFANARFAEMLGHHARDLIGVSVQDLAIDAALMAPFARVLKDRRARDAAACTLRKKDGKSVSVHITSSTIVTGDGRHVATLAMVREAA